MSNQQPQAQGEPDWSHPKIQAVLSSRARAQIELALVQALLESEAPDFAAYEMEYWTSLHDKLRDTLQSHREAIAKRDAALVACVEALEKSRTRVVDGRPAITLSKSATYRAYVSDLGAIDAAIAQANEVLGKGE